MASRTLGGWRVHTASGAVWETAHVVVATGYNHVPTRPSWPGLDTFTGEVVAAASYGSGEPSTTPALRPATCRPRSRTPSRRPAWGWAHPT